MAWLRLSLAEAETENPHPKRFKLVQQFLQQKYLRLFVYCWALFL